MGRISLYNQDKNEETSAFSQRVITSGKAWHQGGKVEVSSHIGWGLWGGCIFTVAKREVLQ